MTVPTFSAGYFSKYTPCAEWTGTNEADILTWIRGLDPSNAAIVEADRWQITATSPNLVLSRPATHPAGYASTATVRPNYWVNASFALNNPSVLNVSEVDPAGKWKTTDKYGRPNNLNDMLPPAPPPV